MKKELDIHVDDEGMISDYESESGMSEEYLLKYLENELRNSSETLNLGTVEGHLPKWRGLQNFKFPTLTYLLICLQ